jgi:hypothetical protein
MTTILDRQQGDVVGLRRLAGEGLDPAQQHREQTDQIRLRLGFEGVEQTCLGIELIAVRSWPR